MIAVSRDVQFPASLGEIMETLLAGPTTVESRFGLQSFLTGSKTDVSVTVVAGIATVDFATNPVQVVGPDQTLAIAQVVYTATQQSGVTGVLFQIAGKPIEVPTSSGVQVPGPVDRSSYIPQAPPERRLEAVRPACRLAQGAGSGDQGTRGASAQRCSRS